MCYNFTVSLWSGIIIYTIATYLYIRNKNEDRFLAYLFYITGLVQFLEAFIWKNIGNVWNAPLMFVLITIHIPFLLYISYINGKDRKSILYQYIWIWICLCILYVLYRVYSMMMYNKRDIVIGKHGHLSWNVYLKNGLLLYLSALLYIVLLYVCFSPYWQYSRTRMICYLSIFFLVYVLLRYFESMEWLSMWCWYVILLAILAVIWRE
jgi:hypothetical protein